MKKFIFCLISLLSIPGITADFGSSSITKELPLEKIIHSACCHWCRVSKNRIHKNAPKFSACPKCKKIYCDKCIEKDSNRAPTDEGCMFCLEECCCFFIKCNEQHLCCYTYRRTIDRHQKNPNMKVYKKPSKYALKESIKYESDESDEVDESHESPEIMIICLEEQNIFSPKPQTKMLENSTLNINRIRDDTYAISIYSIEICVNNGFVDRDLLPAEMQALGLAGSTARTHIQHGSALLQLHNPFNACATFDLSEKKLEYPMIFKQHPLRIQHESFMGVGNNWLTDDKGKTHDLDQVLLAAIKFKIIISSSKSLEEKEYYQKQILTLEESASLGAFTDIGPHGDILCNFYPEKKGTHRLVVIKIEPALLCKIFNQFISMNSINVSELRYDVSRSSLEAGKYYCCLGELQISSMDSQLIFLDPYLSLEFDLKKSQLPRAKEFRPHATWLAEYLPNRGVILRSIQGHELQLNTIINYLTIYFGVDTNNPEYESATCDCTLQGETTIILGRLANNTYVLSMVQIPEGLLQAIFMEKPTEVELNSYIQRYLYDNQREWKLENRPYCKRELTSAFPETITEQRQGGEKKNRF